MKIGKILGFALLLSAAITTYPNPNSSSISDSSASPASAVEDVHTTSSKVLTFRLLHPANLEVSIKGGTTQGTDAHASKQVPAGRT